MPEPPVFLVTVQLDMLCQWSVKLRKVQQELVYPHAPHFEVSVV
jgi:hypothetical protein